MTEKDYEDVTVYGLADDREPGSGRHHHARGTTKGGLIVDDHHADGRAGVRAHAPILRPRGHSAQVAPTTPRGEASTLARRAAAVGG